MRARLAVVFGLGTILMVSPAQAQMAARPDGTPLPPGSRAHVTATASLLELLLAIRLGSPAASLADRPEIAQPHLRRHAAAAGAAALAAVPGLPPEALTPP